MVQSPLAGSHPSAEHPRMVGQWTGVSLCCSLQLDLMVRLARVSSTSPTPIFSWCEANAPKEVAGSFDHFYNMKIDTYTNAESKHPELPILPLGHKLAHWFLTGWVWFYLHRNAESINMLGNTLVLAGRGRVSSQSFFFFFYIMPRKCSLTGNRILMLAYFGMKSSICFPLLD